MERGELSTLTSLALALVPIAVFLGALIFMFGDRSGTTTGDLARAAHAYAEAIAAFEDEHGRPPALRSADWPRPVDGPLSSAGPLLAKVPKPLRRHPFHFIQIGRLDGEAVTVDERVALKGMPWAFIVQYYPHARSLALTGPPYSGYLLRIIDRREHSDVVQGPSTAACEAWGDPVRILCGTTTISKTLVHDSGLPRPQVS
jgi:hypothetical protein